MNTPKEKVLAMLHDYYVKLGHYDCGIHSNEEIDDRLEQRHIIRGLVNQLEADHSERLTNR